MTAVMEKPAEDPEADVARANAAITLVTNRLSEAQLEVFELRKQVGEVAFLAEIDPSQRKALLDLRASLAAAESRVDELQQAERVGRDMAAEAKRRALEARKDDDWQACADLLDEAVTTAGALDSLLQQAGALHQQLRQQMAEAGTRVSPHLRRVEYNVPLPSLDLVLKLVVANAGGPAVPERELLAFGPTERRQVSITGVVTHHARMVLNYRPATEEESSHG